MKSADGTHSVDSGICPHSPDANPLLRLRVEPEGLISCPHEKEVSIRAFWIAALHGEDIHGRGQGRQRSVLQPGTIVSLVVRKNMWVPIKVTITDHHMFSVGRDQYRASLDRLPPFFFYFLLGVRRPFEQGFHLV